MRGISLQTIYKSQSFLEGNPADQIAYGVKGKMNFSVQRKDFSCLGYLVNSYHFVFDVKDFLFQALKMYKEGDSKEILKLLMEYQAFYYTSLKLAELFTADPDVCPENIGETYQLPDTLVLDINDTEKANICERALNFPGF